MTPFSSISNSFIINADTVLLFVLLLLVMTYCWHPTLYQNNVIKLNENRSHAIIYFEDEQLRAGNRVSSALPAQRQSPQ